MGCCGDTGLNQILALSVPVNNDILGTALDVSGLAANKTIEIAGSYSGLIAVYGSHDGTSWAPLITFDSGAGVQQIRQVVPVILKYLAVKKKAVTTSSAVSLSVSAKAACNCDRSGSSGANQFLTLATIPAGAQVGPRPVIDLWTLVSATGLDGGFSVICAGGSFEGVIVVEGSLDGVNFIPVGRAAMSSSKTLDAAGFNVAVKQRAPGTSFVTADLSPIIVPNVVRYLRANLKLGTVYQAVTLTVGGKQNCDCVSGGSPPDCTPGFVAWGPFSFPGPFMAPAIPGGVCLAIPVDFSQICSTSQLKLTMFTGDVLFVGELSAVNVNVTLLPTEPPFGQSVLNANSGNGPQAAVFTDINTLLTIVRQFHNFNNPNPTGLGYIILSAVWDTGDPNPGWQNVSIQIEVV